MSSDQNERRNEDRKQGDNQTSYMDDASIRKPVRSKADDGVEVSWNKYKSVRLAHAGMRSKWSEDEEDKVKISAGNGAKKRSDSNTQEFPYPNAVEPKDGKSDALLTEYNSPKIDFS